jgi:hypothetical protein
MPELDETDAIIWALEERLLDPAVRATSASVGQLLDDDFIEFGASGATYDKASTVEGLQSEQPGPIVHRSMDDFRIRMLSTEIALATYKGTDRYRDGRQRRTLRSSLWVRSGGQWKMTFHQGTVIPENSK